MNKKNGFALHAFYTRIFKRYDLINRLFTFGQDQRWRKIAARECLSEKPREVLDLCCGTGDMALMIEQESLQKIQVTGYDFNESMLQLARKKSAQHDILFVQGDAASMPFVDNQFDSITIGFGFRNLTFNNPAKDKHLDEMFRVLKKKGAIYILESAVPKNLIIRFFYKLYLFLFLIPLGGILSGDIKAYWYLAHSSSEFYSLNEIEEMMLEKGFSELKVRRFLFGATNLIKVVK